MTRIKRGVAASKRRKNVLSKAKGFMWRRKSHYRAAKEALLKAGKYAYRDRRTKKRTTRSLWIIRLNAALRQEGVRYNEFIQSLRKKTIELDRKVLADIALRYPDAFKKLVANIQK